MPRRERDFYETPAWMTRALLSRIHRPFERRRRTAFEPCVGAGGISRVLVDDEWSVATNDIDEQHEAHYHMDATKPEVWDRMDPAAWVIMNPPFSDGLEMVQHAHQHCTEGVAALLRLTFLEPTKGRGEWLKHHPPYKVVVLPRTSFTGGGSDSVTVAWMIWVVFRGHVMGSQIDVVTREERDHLMTLEPQYAGEET